LNLYQDDENDVSVKVDKVNEIDGLIRIGQFNNLKETEKFVDLIDSNDSFMIDGKIFILLHESLSYK
jgi:hypothetical protein